MSYMINMSPDAYGQMLDNQYFDRLYKDAIRREERVNDAKIDLMKAQAEYFRALTKKISGET